MTREKNSCGRRYAKRRACAGDLPDTRSPSRRRDSRRSCRRRRGQALRRRSAVVRRRATTLRSEATNRGSWSVKVVGLASRLVFVQSVYITSSSRLWELRVILGGRRQGGRGFPRGVGRSGVRGREDRSFPYPASFHSRGGSGEAVVQVARQRSTPRHGRGVREIRTASRWSAQAT